MTARELLELAAKAAGIAGEYVSDYNADYYYQGNTEGILYELPQGGWCVWNPLTDDGDALRLAVKCLSFYTLQYSSEDWEYCKQDGYAATRRAIVRAAAEIGKEMK